MIVDTGGGLSIWNNDGKNKQERVSSKHDPFISNVTTDKIESFFSHLSRPNNIFLLITCSSC